MFLNSNPTGMSRQASKVSVLAGPLYTCPGASSMMFETVWSYRENTFKSEVSTTAPNFVCSRTTRVGRSRACLSGNPGTTCRASAHGSRCRPSQFMEPALWSIAVVVFLCMVSLSMGNRGLHRSVSSSPSFSCILCAPKQFACCFDHGICGLP